MWGCNRTVTQMLTITRTRTKTSHPFFDVPASETSQLFSSTSFMAPNPCAPRRRGRGLARLNAPHPCAGERRGRGHRSWTCTPTYEGKIFFSYCPVFFLIFGGGGGSPCLSFPGRCSGRMILFVCHDFVGFFFFFDGLVWGVLFVLISRHCVLTLLCSIRENIMFYGLSHFYVEMTDFHLIMEIPGYTRNFSMLEERT